MFHDEWSEGWEFRTCFGPMGGSLSPSDFLERLERRAALPGF